jgi:large subunit ribosomal protein L21
MKPYVVIKLGTSQHKVSLGDSVTTDRLQDEIGKSLTLNEVLMSVDGDTVQVGAPTLQIPVVLEVISHTKGEKVRVHKFKAKSRYNLTRGSRAYLTTLKVVSIGDKKAAKEVKKEPKVTQEVVSEKVEMKSEKKEPKVAAKKVVKKVAVKAKSEK